MKYPFIGLLLVIAACSSGGGHLMTMDSYYDVPVGSTAEEVIASSGKPYAIHKKADGTLEYEYIERIKAGGRDIQERHYYFLIKDGKVISKRVKQMAPPAYTMDSYDMQTTQNMGN